MSVKDRVKQFVEYNSMSISAFEKRINASNGYVNSISKSIGLDKIETILENFPNINLEWLLTGKGEMLKKTYRNEILTSKDEAVHNRMPTIITVSDEDSGRENIEIVPAKLAAGYVGGGYANPVFIKELPKFRLPFLNNGTFRCFGIEGYSMENGIRDNDFFVGRFLDNIREFGEGKIHALIIPELSTFLLKRVFRHPLNPDMLILRSDNNDTVNTYPDIHIHIKYIVEIWSYAATISFKEPYYNMEKFREILSTNPQKVIYE
ncbi:S24 family peptidase [Elizabethkingia anophelis]|uniref:S24 family peptidase n=1 Tax=Elizabethkingia anophelis TaxID=1117645 RepID=UPI0020B1B2F1|nr:S24/S26 family peptidase [Elizabethkingia anophelis]MCT4318766.1 S24/S26 family peptidase [Elizabethkingia anophelis]UTF97558.1 S24/S26 family peptidase [Elizabethkingia anophelis]